MGNLQLHIIWLCQRAHLPWVQGRIASNHTATMGGVLEEKRSGIL